MKVLVDECVPVKLVRLLTGRTFATAQQKGWEDKKIVRDIRHARRTQ